MLAWQELAKFASTNCQAWHFLLTCVVFVESVQVKKHLSPCCHFAVVDIKEVRHVWITTASFWSIITQARRAARFWCWIATLSIAGQIIRPFADVFDCCESHSFDIVTMMVVFNDLLITELVRELHDWLIFVSVLCVECKIVVALKNNVFEHSFVSDVEVCKRWIYHNCWKVVLFCLKVYAMLSKNCWLVCSLSVI